ncbi:MAG: hypothetical protein IJ598_05340 [Ruminococcus sp.]|nr:hypothetical protein [Ruminococcus sp.]
MKCPHCGFNAENYAFCPVCGQRMAAAVPPQNIGQPQPASEPPQAALPKSNNKALLIIAIVIGAIILSGVLTAVLSRVFYNKSVVESFREASIVQTIGE